MCIEPEVVTFFWDIISGMGLAIGVLLCLSIAVSLSSR
jgi:hypothetical protein